MSGEDDKFLLVVAFAVALAADITDITAIIFAKGAYFNERKNICYKINFLFFSAFRIK